MPPFRELSILQWIAAILLGLAIIHTFLVKTFHHLARKYPEGSVGENFFHLLGEVEIVFGLWGSFLLVSIALIESPHAAVTYLESRDFSEAAFIFVILTVCSTRPLLDVAESLITRVSRLLPLPHGLASYLTTLTVGPVLGSLITEPAAMTVTALLLLDRFYRKAVSENFKYATLGVLFVNVSIGGTLTPYAAPPVLMVADKWGWGLQEMLLRFGWKGALASLVSAAFCTFRFRHELRKLGSREQSDRDGLRDRHTPHWIRLIHVLFLIAIVISAHHPVLVIGLFLFFIGFVHVTSEHQDDIRLRGALLVSFFLSGVVVLGGLQRWWIEPILTRMTALPLYLGAIGLTAFTDNAALTYLGTLVPSLSETSRYALVAGSVVGGGLTVIANAPNPAGYSILRPAFGEDGISPLYLLRAALIPTVISALCFWLL